MVSLHGASKASMVVEEEEEEKKEDEAENIYICIFA